MAVPGIRDQVERKLGQMRTRFVNDVRWGGWTGSVVGIQIEVAEMYTGTLINDLMQTAERVGRKVEQDRITEELHEIFTMQIPIEIDRAFMGAA